MKFQLVALEQVHAALTRRRGDARRAASGLTSFSGLIRRKSLLTACLAVAALSSGSASADTRKPQLLLHGKVKSFECSISVSSRTKSVKQGSSSSESHSCKYKCFVDFNLNCVSEGEACGKLTAAHWDNRSFDLSGRGKGNFIGLDSRSDLKGGIDRRTGALKYSLTESHSFEGDPIFIKTETASGACRPAPGYTPARRVVNKEKRSAGKRRSDYWAD